MSHTVPHRFASGARRVARVFLQPVPTLDIFKIILLCIGAAILYGVLHDQVTARLCVEYFTIGHPRIFATESPTLLAFSWGVVATWWAGALLGVPAALLAQLGSWPRYDARDLLRPVGTLLSVMACAALLSGLIGYQAAESGDVVLLEPLASEIAPEKHAWFLADAGAHLASYGVGFSGGIAVCGWIVYRRWRRSHDKL